jgi:LmbE family N-acetylglucosaminyl deacetylase
MSEKRSITAAVIVAHPDDETIWVGGTLLLHSDWQLTVVSLCRGDDSDRAPKFFRAVAKFKAVANIGNLDDGPDQLPLPETEVQQTILSLLPEKHFDVILTHSPYGEYTRHLRHEETSRAVVSLWAGNSISANEVWMFAYEDGGKRYSPRPIRTAHRLITLPKHVWQTKYSIITDLYGFSPESFEANAVSREEAFWCFRAPDEFSKWLINSNRREQ